MGDLMAYNDTDSFGEYDPTSPTNAFAPTQTPEQIAEAQRQAILRRQRQLQADAQKTASIAAPYQAERTSQDLEATRQNNLTAQTSVGEAGNDWLYPGIVAGTIAGGIAGAGLVGAAGAGAAAAPAYSAVGPAAGGVVSGSAASAPVIAGGAGAAGAGAAGVAGGAAGAAGSGGLTLGQGIGLAGLGLDAAGIIASQIRTKAENDLIEKQKELAAAAKARQVQVQQEGMNRLGQQMLAFTPLNRAMQEMYGQGAGYSPEQMGAMTADPGANPAAAGQGFNPDAPGQYSLEEIRRANADKERQARVSGAFGPAQGPAPLKPRTPMPARSF
jgi:hypothetical protein